MLDTYLGHKNVSALYPEFWPEMGEIQALWISSRLRSRGATAAFNLCQFRYRYRAVLINIVVLELRT